MRNCLLAVVVGLLAFAGCDDRDETPANLQLKDVSTQTTQPAASEVTRPNEPFKNIPLGVIPFTADVPESWAVQSGVANRIVLHGTLEGGELDILLSSQPVLDPDSFNAFIAEQKAAATRPSKAITQVLTRDTMTIVETIDKPLDGLVTFNVRYFVTGPKLEYQVYALNIGDLTQEMYDKDGELIRKVLLSLKYDAAATELPR